MLVGVGSTARAGKDTAANALVRDLGFTKISFATPLKDLAALADPIILPGQSSVNTPSHNRLSWVLRGSGGWEAAKDRYPEVRRILQALGVGARAVFGEDFWIDQAFKLANRQEHVVIPDVRFINEAQAIKDKGGFLVKINRPGHGIGDHRSERELADWTDWDLTVDNNATIPELEHQVVEWAKTQLRKAA
jgi:hypothetical protein